MFQKAPNRRKRHIPPGPCGIWFQTQQQLNKQGYSSSTVRSAANRGSAAQVAEDSYLRDVSNAVSNGSHGRHEELIEDMSFSPAWTCMQQELNIVTPYLPPTVKEPSERHRLLRPHLPANYVLLHEIKQGNYDFRFPPRDRDGSTQKSLLVLVSSVESHIHHNTWTVELQDESGSSIKAWVEPTLVQHQLQQQQEMSIIRPGVVWLLRQIGMILVPPPPDDEDRLERMLLVTRDAIQNVWTPEQVKEKYNPETDSPGRQKQFLEWMEKRKALPVEGIHNDETVDIDPDDEEDSQHAEEDNEVLDNSRLPTEEMDLDGFAQHKYNSDDQRTAKDPSLLSEASFLRRGPMGTHSQTSSQFETQDPVTNGTTNPPWSKNSLASQSVPLSPSAVALSEQNGLHHKHDQNNQTQVQELQVVASPGQTILVDGGTNASKNNSQRDGDVSCSDRETQDSDKPTQHASQGLWSSTIWNSEPTGASCSNMFESESDTDDDKSQSAIATVTHEKHRFETDVSRTVHGCNENVSTRNMSGGDDSDMDEGHTEKGISSMFGASAWGNMSSVAFSDEDDSDDEN